MTDRSQILDYIKATALQLLPGCKIMLFGSRARKDYDIGSDYDFLIISTNNIPVKEKMVYKAQIRKQLAKEKIVADVLIQSESEVKIKRRLLGHIVREIIKEGIFL